MKNAGRGFTAACIARKGKEASRQASVMPPHTGAQNGACCLTGMMYDSIRVGANQNYLNLDLRPITMSSARPKIDSTKNPDLGVSLPSTTTTIGLSAPRPAAPCATRYPLPSRRNSGSHDFTRSSINTANGPKMKIGIQVISAGQTLSHSRLGGLPANW